MIFPNRPRKYWVTALTAGLAAVALAGCPLPEECLQCGAFETVGTISTGEILECSGLVASQTNPGILWIHNDSGNTARLFALTEDGSLRGTYTIQGAVAYDWEDMAWGPCSVLGWADCLYIGDIGDNAHARERVQIYRIEEPLVPLEGPPVTETLYGVERFDCEYPDVPHDAEALLVDPEEGIPYIATKGEEGRTAVYRFPATPDPYAIATLELVTDLPTRSWLTAGDVSPDASRVILRNYLTAFDYPRSVGESFEQMFLKAPCFLPIALELQGEALAIGPSGMEVYTVPEGAWAPIHYADCVLP